MDVSIRLTINTVFIIIIVSLIFMTLSFIVSINDNESYTPKTVDFDISRNYLREDKEKM